MTRLAKFYTVSDPLISGFISSIPLNFSDIIRLLKPFTNVAADPFVLGNRIKLKSSIRRFHSEADTLSSVVSKHIDLLGDPFTQILVSMHQPNLFPYGGIYKKIVLLETLKKKLEEADPNGKIINLFIVIDHEFVDDRWICHAQLPDVHHPSGIMQLTYPIVKSQKRWLVKNVDKPSLMMLDRWRKQIRSWIRETLLVPKSSQTGTTLLNFNKSKVLDNFDHFWAKVESVRHRAKSLADFNAFLLSEMINKVFGYSTLFVRASEISPAVEDGIKYLVSNFHTYSEVLQETEKTLINHGINTRVSTNVYKSAPVWLHCKCGSKASVRLTKSGRQTLLTGICLGCRQVLRQDLGNSDAIDISGSVQNLSLRAVPTPILLARDLGVACLVSGTGGMGYVTDAAVISKMLSVRFPLIALWTSVDIYNGIGQSTALRYLGTQERIDVQPLLGKLEHDNEVYASRIKALTIEKSRMVRNNIPIDQILQEIFALKQEQRKLRKRIELVQRTSNIMNLSSCFIDYAVNFGMDNIESEWRSHLLENGNLAAPIYMNNSADVTL
ncbi:hypothetical protein Ngar_c14970 [Candidatus Nitrososphaera gargensis Ga9.2]|uniref:Uncharacterized protein n=2 Tax=Candidatus Nitrososphaera gargensis TaxID=497727 RepID=K0IJI0_NITGG|nr:hypothetical protein Ngar_c14970 [Candidatus Nitrososphaera gargensis Ga9.2]